MGTHLGLGMFDRIKSEDLTYLGWGTSSMTPASPNNIENILQSYVFVSHYAGLIRICGPPPPAISVIVEFHGDFTSGELSTLAYCNALFC